MSLASCTSFCASAFMVLSLHAPAILSCASLANWPSFHFLHVLIDNLSDACNCQPLPAQAAFYLQSGDWGNRDTPTHFHQDEVTKKKYCRIIASVSEVKSNLSVALGWSSRCLRKTCAIKWQKVSALCIQLPMSPNYTLSLKNGAWEFWRWIRY